MTSEKRRVILGMLLLQQLRRHNNVIWLDFADIELKQNIISVDEAEQLVGGSAVQLSSFVGVDMRKHKVNILLLRSSKLVPFGRMRRINSWATSMPPF